MMKKKNIYFLGFLVLLVAVCYTAIFYISQIKVINENLMMVIQHGKAEIVSPKKEGVYLKDFSKIRENLILLKSDFLEANLPEMRVYFYRAGVLEKEFPILVKGDPQDWGGSASGLYRVISGNKTSYSIIAEVYMPYALRYYGKYYIHGEPYYPGGGKRYTEATGGCIQVSDEDARAIFNLAEINMPFLVVDKENDNYRYESRKNNKLPEISAKSYLIADLDSGFVFAEKNSKEKWPIASLTKLMTAVVVAENIDLRKSIQITSQMLKGYGETPGLDIGKNYRLVELFYPLLISSSNDAAQAISYFLSWDKTVKLMNEKAKAILMENTEFASPGGFATENVSTADDLFYLLRYILNNRPPLLKITKNEDVQAFGEVRFQDLNNKNLFFEDPDFIGGKTGYIPDSKYNGIFIFRFPMKDNSERKVAIILLGSPKLDDASGSLKNDTEKIINWLKENYFSPMQSG
jgi:D-alanyl-D-alanine carboxypeptidase